MSLSVSLHFMFYTYILYINEMDLTASHKLCKFYSALIQ